jgi:hypothetical protein
MKTVFSDLLSDSLILLGWVSLVSCIYYYFWRKKKKQEK